MPVNYDPYGFDSFDTMFGIVFVIIAVGFVIVFGSIIVCGFQGAAQWKKPVEWMYCSTSATSAPARSSRVGIGGGDKVHDFVDHGKHSFFS